MVGSRSGRSWTSLNRLALVVAVAGAPLAIQAQPTKSRVPVNPRCNEQIVNLSHVPTLYVSPHGFGPGPFQGVPGRSCNQAASLTDANFGNLTAYVEAGMGEGEMAGATYTVAAAEWPIKINLTEVILAQSQAIVNTTTHWSLLFYQGTPDSGTLVETFSSDDIALPHAQIPAGTNGININFSIDPGDPEQLIIQDNGTHKFSVAFRIDQHNNQFANPCNSAPPSSSNAFPVVDNSGVSSLANNWLYGLNCDLGTTFNCPPMPPLPGGPAAAWGTFGAMLPAPFCRPSGDWVMRTTWSSVLLCTPGVGACCLPSGDCQILATATCTSQSGQYRGDGVSCANANCVVLVGACCLPNGSCLAGQTSTQCTGQNGTFQGQGSVCGTCPQPTGACCFGTSCLNLTASDCATAQGAFLGNGSACSSGVCPTGACCLPSGQCLSGVTSLACSNQSGTFRGVGTNCSSPCPQPSGACCLSGGSCLNLTQSDCSVIPNSAWAGALTTCASGACAQPCYANCDAVGGLTGNDFQCFLDKFVSGQSYANCDGVGGLTGNDFQCFLNKFVAGCS